MIAAWARMCRILGKDFEQYLPLVMGPVLRAAALKPEVTMLDSKLARYCIQSQRNRYVFCGIGYLPLNVKLIRYFVFFYWVFVSFLLGITTFSLYLLYNINYFNWVFIYPYAYCYPLFEKELGI